MCGGACGDVYESPSLAQKYPHVAGLSTVGQSVEGRQLWVMRIARDPDRKSLGKPKFGYVGNMHGNEAVSRQVLVCLLARYGEEERITELVNGTDVCIVPGMSPDGFERSTEGDCSGDHSGRNNAKNKDLSGGFPDQFDKSNVDPADIPEVMEVMRWIQEMGFVLSGGLHGGTLVASYPFDDSASHEQEGHYSPSADDGLFRQLALVYRECRIIRQVVFLRNFIIEQETCSQ
uniref:Peptidase M14 domain-containing protein n=1 Tax=Maylandia zebra TaxID=106582 RepID=A0A3P9CRA6_9CICH